jgi:hypothetical protein
VGHHGELEAVQAVRGGPVLRVLEQPGADAEAGRVGGRAVLIRAAFRAVLTGG